MLQEGGPSGEIISAAEEEPFTGSTRTPGRSKNPTAVKTPDTSPSRLTGCHRMPSYNARTHAGYHNSKAVAAEEKDRKMMPPPEGSWRPMLQEGGPPVIPQMWTSSLMGCKLQSTKCSRSYRWKEVFEEQQDDAAGEGPTRYSFEIEDNGDPVLLHVRRVR
ncbi:hypothetical protein V8C26DRAFT_165631 [Trichoderma gracile]